MSAPVLPRTGVSTIPPVQPVSLPNLADRHLSRTSPLGAYGSARIAPVGGAAYSAMSFGPALSPCGPDPVARFRRLRASIAIACLSIASWCVVYFAAQLLRAVF